MNHSKIILVGCISAFVAITTALLGVAGTIIGSVLSSVLYNVLSEALEKPVENAKISTNFEWDIAYVFPLIVILIIQLMLILAFLSEWGFLPKIFLNIYLSIQGVASNNLYRILGLSLVVMCAYPFVIKRNYVKRFDGIVILFVGLLFLARGFSDMGNSVSQVFRLVYSYVDFPIALIAFLLLVYVVHSILSSARESEKSISPVNVSKNRNLDDLELKHIEHRRKPSRNLDDLELRQVRYSKRAPKNSQTQSRKRFNDSADEFQFESNDLLDDFKK
ncbi:MAG: hypothetical protein U0K80_01005 [Methanobrevibacter sp.]|nr:hypothetical protein [Methanobrevibacter sp.]